MSVKYTDIDHVAESVEQIVENTRFKDDSVRLSVYDVDAVMVALSPETVDERNLRHLMDTEICSFKYDGTELTVRFHENQMIGTFELNPAGAGAIGANQTNDIKRLAPKVGTVLTMLEREFDVISYDFTEVSAGSVASGGHFTDFEFEFVVTSTDI